MADVFKKKRRDEMFTYSRPNIGYYENISGEIVEAAPNVMRIEYKNGYPYGVKLGDGDFLQIPLTADANWPTQGSGTFICVMNAPLGVPFLRCGDLILEGVGVMKTYIINIDNSTNLSNIVEVSFNRDVLTSDAHLLMVKYYGNTIDFSGYEDFEAMEELNAFVHGDWY